MENRKRLYEYLNSIDTASKSLRELIEESSDEWLNEILIDQFDWFVTFIGLYFEFLETIVARQTPDAIEMTNDELEKYFKENADLVTLV